MYLHRRCHATRAEKNQQTEKPPYLPHAHSLSLALAPARYVNSVHDTRVAENGIQIMYRHTSALGQRGANGVLYPRTVNTLPEAKRRD